jgi:hypothetical protein
MADLNFPTESMERAWRDYGRAVRSRFNVEPIKVHLRATEEKERSMCGEHGRVIPTKQDLCPKCGGPVIDIPTSEEALGMEIRAVIAAALDNC